MRPAFETAGDIRSVDLLASFVSLWRENGSGELRFSRSGASAGFEILDGEIVASHSSQSQFDVAAILERGGKLDRGALERLNLPEAADPAIAALQAGLLTVREWKWGQKIRAIEILSDLLGWLEGEYTHDPAVLPQPGDWTLPIPRLILELFLRSRDRTLVEHYLGPSDLPLLRSEHFDEEFEGFGLTSDAGSVIKLIDGKATAEEIAAKAPAEEFAVLKLLAALTTLGLIHPQEAAAPRPAAPAPRKRKRETPKETQRPVEEEKAAPPAAAPPTPIAEEEEEKTVPEVRQEAPAAPSREEEPPLPPEPPLEEIEEIAEIASPAPSPPEPAPAAVRSAGQLPVLPFDTASTPADLMSEPYEEPPLREPEIPVLERRELERDLGGYEPPSPPLPPSFDPPSSGGRGGRGGLLAGLLAVLVLAVAVVVVMRTRSRAPAGAASPAAAPTAAQDVPVFPPAETAVPLPRRGRRTPAPSPAAVVTTATAQPAATPSPTPRATLPVPTKTPTASPTRPVPTKTPTATATRPAPTRTSTAKPTSPPTKTRTPSPTSPPPTKTRTATPTRPVPTKTWTPVPTRPAPTKTPTAMRTLAPTKRPSATPRPVLPTPTKALPAAKPPTRAPAATPAPTPQPAISGTGEGARGEWIRRAERDRQALSKRSSARYAVQLELACEIETLEKAWAWDKPAGTMWLLTTPYRGRTCFRVLWGHYATLAQAQAARAKIPSFFVVPGNRPVAVSVR